MEPLDSCRRNTLIVAVRHHKLVFGMAESVTDSDRAIVGRISCDSYALPSIHFNFYFPYPFVWLC